MGMEVDHSSRRKGSLKVGRVPRPPKAAVTVLATSIAGKPRMPPMMTRRRGANGVDGGRGNTGGGTERGTKMGRGKGAVAGVRLRGGGGGGGTRMGLEGCEAGGCVGVLGGVAWGGTAGGQPGSAANSRVTQSGGANGTERCDRRWERAEESSVRSSAVLAAHTKARHRASKFRAPCRAFRCSSGADMMVNAR